MKPSLRCSAGYVFAALILIFTPQFSRAEVTRVEITSRQDVLNGKSFGTVGAYERLSGKIYFAVDPDNPHNKIIVDLDKAPRNTQGKVEFSSDLFIIRPKDPSRANGVAFFDVVNRGNKGLLGVFNRAKGSSDPTTDADYGDVRHAGERDGGLHRSCEARRLRPALCPDDGKLDDEPDQETTESEPYPQPGAAQPAKENALVSQPYCV